ncbi:MAG: hypothetical protein ACYCV6_05955 [Steroidobacteraceae bacterium]
MSSTGRRRRKPTTEPDLDGSLGKFSHATALIRVSHRSLNASEFAGDEEFVLRTGLAALDEVYTEFDLAIIAVHRRAPLIKRSHGHPSATRGRAAHG